MNEAWPIHTLVFDLDDTLYAEADFVRSGFRAVDAWMQKHQGLAGFGALVERLFEAGVRGDIFDRALRSLGRHAGPDLVEQLVEAYRAHMPDIALLPEAEECLRWADTRFRLALLSDGFAATQQRKVDALGIAALFDCIMLTDTIGRAYWKPNPAGFQRIAAALPGAAEGYVYVADNPRKDFIAPRALGWRTIRVRRAGGEHFGYEADPLEAAEREISSLYAVSEFVIPWRQ